MDSNPVFDSVFVSNAASTFTLDGALVADVESCTTCNSANNNPSDTVAMIWTLSSFSLTDGDFIYVPYNIVLTFAAPDLMFDATTYYDSWTWATTCTNTQFGEETTADGVTTTPVMSTLAPTCTTTTSTAYGNSLTIAITDENDSMMPSTWDNWEVMFAISVTNPSNWIGKNAYVDAHIENGFNGMTIAKTSSTL